MTKLIPSYLLASALLLIGFLTINVGNAQISKPGDDNSDSDKQELLLYRSYVPKLISDLKTCTPGQIVGPSVQAAYDKYLVSYYDQASSFRSIRADLYRWQLLAGNSVLVVVLIMSIGGFVITGLQIFQLHRLKYSSKTNVIYSIA